jgi:hypothetical protein
LRTKDIHNDIKPFFAYEDFKELNAAQISDLYRKLLSVYFYNSEKVKDLSLNFGVASAQSSFKVQQEMSKTFWLQPNINLNLFPNLKKLLVPTFILHGKQDIVPTWTAQKIKDAIPKSEIVVLDHCDHFPYIEQPSQFFSDWNETLKRADIEGFVFHGIRHHFATLMARAGASNLQIKTALGHKTLQMLERYSHLEAQSTRNLVKRLKNNLRWRFMHSLRRSIKNNSVPKGMS